MKNRLLSFFGCALLACGSTARAEENLAELDLATLMSMDVVITSAARHAQMSADAAAAVYVVTREDILRSGVTSLPQLLRHVPGLQVARISPRGWSVTARGFGTRFSNKLLVLVDGRSIYNALFSGVLWEEQPLLLDNIERIEVVRGPGGALWGMNAVNGVINIITRTAADTSGLYMEAGAGSYERIGAVRVGADASSLGAYRLFASHREIDSYDSDKTPLRSTHGGWRWDKDAFGGELSFQGALVDSDFSDYDSMLDSVFSKYATTGDIIVSWRRALAAGDVELRSHYGWVDRSAPIDWDDSTIGVDAQFSAARIGRHLLTAGAELRRVEDEQRGDIPTVSLTEREGDQQRWSLYAQDELHYRNDAVRVTLGGKLERFEYTGLAFQPTVRALWKVNKAHTFWAAASRALRSPSRVELHLDLEAQIADDPPLYYELTGADDLQEEELLAYELGWRWRAAETLSFDAALYRNDYSDLIGTLDLPPTLDPGPPPRFIVSRQVYANLMSAETRGLELTAEWQAAAGVRFVATGAWFDVHSADVAGEGTLIAAGGRIDPERSYSLQARIDLTNDIEVDASWRYVDDLQGLDVDSYHALDVRLAWRMTPSIEASLTIENALGGEHVEFADEIADAPGVDIKRAALARIIWRPRIR